MIYNSSSSRLYLLTIALISLFVVSCKNANHSTITVVVNNIDSIAEVKLFSQDFEKTTLVKEIKMSPKKFTYTFKVGELVEPTFFHLHVNEKRSNVAVLLLEPKEQVNITIDNKDFLAYEVMGSLESKRTQRLLVELSRTVKSLDSLNSLYGKASTNAQRIELSNQYQTIVDRYRDFSKSFIWENPMSRANVMALYQKFNDDLFVFDRSEDLQMFKIVGSSLIALYPESNYSKGILRDIKNQEKIITSYNLSSIIKQAESTLPEIALPNIYGDTIRLSSLKGKVILLDFWSSLNQASLLENRELFEVYAQFKGKGFEIFQVCLDLEKETWTSAIESARLPWINVSPLKEGRNNVIGAYNITEIPANYLIDKNFNIIGKNVFGKDLVDKIKQAL
jgi:peroxiredoxin